MFRRILSLALFGAFATPAISQATDPKINQEDILRRKEAAVSFLRETMMDVANLRTLENRISFNSELAALMWYYDDQEARAMFGTAVNDFKALLQRYDQQMNTFGPSDSDDTSYNPFMGEPSERAKVTRKFRTAIGVRQQLAMSIAEHEPEIAYNFFLDSLSTITNPEFREQMEQGDAAFEQRLIAQIAQTNASKAAELARRTLDRGFTAQHVEFLKQLYAKDQEKAVEFGSALFGKLKESKPEQLELWAVNSLLDYGGENLENSQVAAGKRAIFSISQLREIADILARGILENKPDDPSGLAYLSSIEEYAPARAAQIRSKFKAAGDARDGVPKNIFTIRGERNADPPPPAMAPPPDYRGPVSTTGRGSGVGNGLGNSASTARKQEEEKLMQDVADLTKKELPKEERDRLIARARDVINRTPGKEKKIAALSMLAAQAKRAGDQELASEIMRDAAALVSSNPKTYQDFMYTWMLVSGYAEAEPEKAYSTLDDTILRANELISAFVRIAEFIDVAEEIVVDGEFQVGAFGGGMIRGFTRGIGFAEGTMQKLVTTDIQKTRALTNRFDRPELRVLVKTMVLRTLLDPKKKGLALDVESGAPPDSDDDEFAVPPPPPPVPARRP